MAVHNLFNHCFVGSHLVFSFFFTIIHNNLVNILVHVLWKFIYRIHFLKGVMKSENQFSWVQLSSVTQSCPTLCHPMNHSTPGLPIHHQLPEFIQTHVHWVNDAIQPSHPLLSPSLPSFNLSQHQGLFKWVSSSHQVAKILGVSASTSVLPMNTQDWSPLRWTGWISLQFKGLSRVFSNTTGQKHQFFGAQLFYSPTLTSMHDYWKNHSLD